MPCKASVYALAMSSTGNVVAAGSSEHLIRLWDTRTGEKVGAQGWQLLGPGGAERLTVGVVTAHGAQQLCGAG